MDPVGAGLVDLVGPDPMEELHEYVRKRRSSENLECWAAIQSFKQLAVVGMQRFGIHTNGMSTGNSATRITRSVFRNLRRWCQAGSA